MGIWSSRGQENPSNGQNDILYIKFFRSGTNNIWNSSSVNVVVRPNAALVILWPGSPGPAKGAWTQGEIIKKQCIIGGYVRRFDNRGQSHSPFLFPYKHNALHWQFGNCVKSFLCESYSLMLSIWWSSFFFTVYKCTVLFLQFNTSLTQ